MTRIVDVKAREILDSLDKYLAIAMHRKCAMQQITVTPVKIIRFKIKTVLIFSLCRPLIGNNRSTLSESKLSE